MSAPRGSHRRLMARLALALLAVLAVVAPDAAAHTPATFVFTNKAENTRITSAADGTGSSSHHVFDLPGMGTMTCNTATFEGTATAAKVTSIQVKATYAGCSAGGVDVTFSMGDCEFSLGADGSFAITSAAGKNCSTKPILIETKKGCWAEISEQVLSGLSFTNINPSGKNEEVTMAMAVPKISGVTSILCTQWGGFTTGEYETGNTILRGEEDPGAGLIPMKRTATVP